MKALKDYPGITSRDINNIKGALRRAFSRSELRSRVIEAAIVEHYDPDRPKVKKWVRCNVCSKLDAKSYAVVDHILPMVPIEDHFDNMPIEVSVARLWCNPSNLQAICAPCHDKKTAQEKAARKPYAKPRKKKTCTNK